MLCLKVGFPGNCKSIPAAMGLSQGTLLVTGLA